VRLNESEGFSAIFLQGDFSSHILFASGFRCSLDPPFSSGPYWGEVKKTMIVTNKSIILLKKLAERANIYKIISEER
jgi:hypothetical protein